MKSYDVILFDLDGTLTDPEHGLIESHYYGLTKMGIEIKDKSALRRYIGPTLFDIWQEDFGFSPDETREAIRLFREYFSVYGWWDNKVYDGVREMLIALGNSGKRLALATSKPEIFAKKILDKFALTEYFEFIGAATLDTTRDKKWQVIEYALAEMGITDRDRCILVGDRMYDAEGASICGIDSLGVRYGHGTREELAASGFTYLAATPSEVASLLK
ncbi:MAG: HAD hydrolase-like protein [Clostridia bacterium]|nr:HAD hydrolase-like protein [Clostridia bacterium]